MPYTKDLHQGKFIPRNPLKYKGNINEIVYRSSYELKFMNWCDLNDDITEWGSEIIAIPYRSPIDRKVHRYFPDFYMKVRQANGTIKKFIVEVKPKYQCKSPPANPPRRTKRWLNEVKTWTINEAKWKSANEFCLDHGMEFKILTEDHLNIKYK